MEKQQRDRRHQAKSSRVHSYRNTGGKQIGLFSRIRIGHSGKGLDQAHDGSEKPKQGGNIGEQGHVGRALFQLRDDLHHAFLHSDLDIFATPVFTKAG